MSVHLVNVKPTFNYLETSPTEHLNSQDVELNNNTMNKEKKVFVHYEQDLAQAQKKNLNSLTSSERMEYKKYLKGTQEQLNKLKEKNVEIVDERSTRAAKIQEAARPRSNSCSDISKVQSGSLKDKISKDKLKELEKYEIYAKIFQLVKYVGLAIGVVAFAALFLTVASPALVPLLITIGAVAAIFPWIVMVFADGAFASVWVKFPTDIVNNVFFSSGGTIALSVMGGVTVLGGILAGIGFLGENYYQKKITQIYLDSVPDINKLNKMENQTNQIRA